MILELAKNFRFHDFFLMIALAGIAYMLAKLNLQEAGQYDSLNNPADPPVQSLPDPQPPKAEASMKAPVETEPPQEKIQVSGYLKYKSKGAFEECMPEEASYILYSDHAIAMNMALPTSRASCQTYRFYHLQECFMFREGNTRVQDPIVFSIHDILEYPYVEKTFGNTWTLASKGTLSIRQ